MAVRVRVGAWLVALAMGVAAGSAAASGSSSHPAGPDVASFQHPRGAGIDWAKVRRSGAAFAFVKATEGTSYTNPYFTRDYAAAHDAGLVRSAYHFARPNRDLASAEDQARHLVDVAGTAGSKGDLPLTLDLEQSGGLSPADLVSWTQAFVAQVQALTGRTTIIYSYPAFWERAMANSDAFADLPLWIASYRKGGPKTPLPGGWKSWTFWQYTSRGSQPGIRGSVDESLFSGDRAALQALADPTTPTGVAGPAPVPLPIPLHLPYLPNRPLSPTTRSNAGAH